MKASFGQEQPLICAAPDIPVADVGMSSTREALVCLDPTTAADQGNVDASWALNG